MPIRSVAPLLPLLLVACQAADRPGNSVAAASAADRALVATALAADQVAAARAYLVPFTGADQAACFDDAGLGGAAMQAREGMPDGRIARVVIAVDGSGSMAGRIGGRTKLDLARDATGNFVASLPPAVEAALLSFGQRGDNSAAGKAASCAGVDLLAPMARDRAQLNAAVTGMKAVGWTPLAAGLERAEGMLAASRTPGEQVIYVVSDGIETCGGDPVAVARRINTGATRAIINIVGFGLPRGEAATLQRVAGAGGGNFVNVTDDAGFQRAMADFRERGRLIENRVGARVAGAGNDISTGAAITGATICTGKILTDETLAVGADLTARQQSGRSAPPRNVVFAVLRQRHDAMTARRDAFAARLKGTRDHANTAIDAQEKAAR